LIFTARNSKNKRGVQMNYGTCDMYGDQTLRMKITRYFLLAKKTAYIPIGMGKGLVKGFTK